MFNRWKPFPKYEPNKKGWYICSIRYGDEKDQAYVMDLWWDDTARVWRDNRRLNVYETYEVFGWVSSITDTPVKKRIYSDGLCIRNDVIAFKRLPKIYK